MSWQNSCREHLKNSVILPALYTFFTLPFSKSLRALPVSSPKIPASPKKVSVVIPNYNYKKYLKKRLLSILHQTYPIFELIILDDASTDGSAVYLEKIIPKLRCKFPGVNIKFLPNAKNSGKSINQWQKAFREASGNFLWLAEADDLSDINFLATVMDKFKNPDVILSFSNSVAINRHGFVLSHNFQNQSVDKLKSGHFFKDFISSGESEVEHHFAINCEIPNVSATVFRLDPKIPYEKYLLEAKKFRQVGDWYFYLQVLKHGKLAYSPAALNFFRIHKSSVTAHSKKTTRHLEEIEFIHRLLAEEYHLPEQTKAAIKEEEDRIRKRSTT